MKLNILTEDIRGNIEKTAISSTRFLKDFKLSKEIRKTVLLGSFLFCIVGNSLIPSAQAYDHKGVQKFKQKIENSTLLSNQEVVSRLQNIAKKKQQVIFVDISNQEISFKDTSEIDLKNTSIINSFITSIENFLDDNDTPVAKSGDTVVHNGLTKSNTLSKNPVETIAHFASRYDELLTTSDISYLAKTTNSVIIFDHFTNSLNEVPLRLILHDYPNTHFVAGRIYTISVGYSFIELSDSDTQEIINSGATTNAKTSQFLIAKNAPRIFSEDVLNALDSETHKHSSLNIKNTNTRN